MLFFKGCNVLLECNCSVHFYKVILEYLNDSKKDTLLHHYSTCLRSQYVMFNIKGDFLKHETFGMEICAKHRNMKYMNLICSISSSDS